MNINHRNQSKADNDLPLNRSAGSVFQPLQSPCETSNTMNDDSYSLAHRSAEPHVSKLRYIPLFLEIGLQILDRAVVQVFVSAQNSNAGIRSANNGRNRKGGAVARERSLRGSFSLPEYRAVAFLETLESLGEDSSIDSANFRAESGVWEVEVVE